MQRDADLMSFPGNPRAGEDAWRLRRIVINLAVVETRATLP